YTSNQLDGYGGPCRVARHRTRKGGWTTENAQSVEQSKGNHENTKNTKITKITKITKKTERPPGRRSRPRRGVNRAATTNQIRITRVCVAALFSPLAATRRRSLQSLRAQRSLR